MTNTTTITIQDLYRLREQAEKAAHDFMEFEEDQRVYFKASKALKKAVEQYNSISPSKVKLERVRTLLQPTDRVINDGVYVYDIVVEHTESERMAQSIIDEWNGMSEQEQYNMLKYSIVGAGKHFNLSFALELNEPEELIGEAWIVLHGKMNVEHIREVIERKNGITLSFLVFTAATYTLSKIMYNHRRKNKEYGNSLNELIGKEEDTELLEILPDAHTNVENQVISQMMVDDMIKNLKPKHKTIMRYTMEGYTPRDISHVTEFKPQAIRQCLAYVRKKLGRTEKPAAIDFDRFAKAYERVLSGDIKAIQCRRELDMKEGTFYIYVNKYRMTHNMPVAPYLMKQKRFAEAFA